MTLTYGSKGFATRAQQLIGLKQPFSIVVGDPAASGLRGRIKDGRLVDPVKMTAITQLRPLIAVVMLAAASGGTYEIREAGQELVVTVFWGSAQSGR